MSGIDDTSIETEGKWNCASISHVSLWVIFLELNTCKIVQLITRHRNGIERLAKGAEEKLHHIDYVELCVCVS